MTNIPLHTQLELKRLRRGLSRQRLSDITGLSTSHIEKIEYGQTNPRPHTLELLTKALRIRVFVSVVDDSEVQE